MESEAKEVKTLDEIISADCKGDLKKARDFFKMAVQDILKNSQFKIEDTVRNNGIKEPITKGEFNQIKQMLLKNVNIAKFPKDNLELVSKAKQQGLDTLLQNFNVSDNKSGEKYKNFIKQLVSVENYFDKIKDAGKQIKEVYDKIESSLKHKNEDNIFFSHPVMFDSHNNGFIGAMRNENGSAINGYDNLTKEQKDEIKEWAEIFNILTKLGVLNSSKDVSKNIFSSLKSGSGFYIEVNWRDTSIYSKLNDRQIKLLEKMEKENADRALKAKCQEYIKSKTYDHEDDLFSILDAIAAVNLELCMRELDELTKSAEKSNDNEENKKNEDKNENNKNIIIVENENEKDLESKEKKCKEIKEQLKHRARLLGFNDSDAFCDVIDKISTEPIDKFKEFAADCQKKFDVYQKDCGFIPMVPSSTKNQEDQELLIEAVRKAKKLGLDIVKYFYTEAKKQAREILNKKKENEKNKNNPKILAVEFVLDLMDNVNKNNLNTEISQQLQFLANGTKQLDEKGDFGFENLQSIVKSISSTQNLPNGELFDLDSVRKFYDLLSKTDNEYSKDILNAIDSLKYKQTVENFLKDILNRQDKTLVSDFFAFAFADKQDANRRLVYVKKFYLTILDQFFVNFENDFGGYEFLSLVFKPYFDAKISEASTTEKLKPIIESVRSFLYNFCLSNDTETSLNLLINNMNKIGTKDDLEAFLDSYEAALSIIENNNEQCKQYANRKLLVDLKDIFLDKNLDSKVALENISSVVNLLTKLDKNPNDVQEKDFEGLSNVLLAYAEQLIKNQITGRFPLLSETLKFQCKASTLEKFTLEGKQNLINCMTDIATKDVFVHNNALRDQNKDALINYFWLNTTKILEQGKKFIETEAEEICHFIEKESLQPGYLKLLFNAIEALKLKDGKSISKMLNQDNNFKNILTLKNGKHDEEKKAAYKSILKSLVKQKLNQKDGFVARAYLKHYENEIDNNINKTIEELQNGIVTGVNKVLDNKFQPDRKILMEAIGDLKDNDNKALSDFWKLCEQKEKNQAEEKQEELIVPINNQQIDDKAEIKIDDKDKILSELSDIFLDLINNKNKDNENKNEDNEDKNENENENINNDNESDLNLIDITKKFVGSLYESTDEQKKFHTNVVKLISDDKDENKDEKNNHVKQDNTGITEVLKKYYNTINKDKLSKNSLGSFGAQVLLEQINNFQKLNGDSQIKLLQCMKNIKNNHLTNDDLVYINLCAYETETKQLDNPFKELKLITDQNDNSGQTLVKFFQNYGGGYFKNVGPNFFEFTKMTEDQIKSVIKNIGKEKIDNPDEKKNFAGAVVFVLEKQIQYLKEHYETNSYKIIDQIEDKYKNYWQSLISALEKKGLVSDNQQQKFNRCIDNACDLYAIVGFLEWILALLGSIATLGILSVASKGIRNILHSPLQARLTRHLIKSTDGDNGIFSMLKNIANGNIPKQENSIDGDIIK